MLTSVGNSGFTNKKVSKDTDGPLSKTVHIPMRHYKILMEKALEANPQSYIRYKHLNA